MDRQTLWVVVIGLMVFSLVLGACQPAAPPSAPTAPTIPTAPAKPAEEKLQTEVVKPSGEVPKYGGTLTFVLGGDPTWNLLSLGAAAPHQLSHQRVWDGDWAKGAAGGYGTNEVVWETSTNIPQFKAGYLAESVTFKVDSVKDEVTTVIQMRPGIRYALDPKSEASRLVAGREVTADDEVYNLNQRLNNPAALNYQLFPSNRGLKAIKTSPREVSITLPVKEHLAGTMRLLDATLIFPPEILEKYGTPDFSNWQNSVGTGPFMVADYVPGSSATVVRNPNYWMRDPVGLGKGNQLPYVDTVKFLIIPDASTRQAALRTAKADQMAGFNLEDARDMSKRLPNLKKAPGGSINISPAYMRTDMDPFKDVRVRRAMMMATDFNNINQNLYGGEGQILSWPYPYSKAYAGLYLGLDDPEMPASVKELYSYNPDKAKQLLKEAGYPTGFKTELVLTSTQVDYYAIVKDMWSKVGIDLTLRIVEGAAVAPTITNKGYQGLIAVGYSPPSTYPEQAHYTGVSWLNASQINDPVVNESVAKTQTLAITDFPVAMKQTKDLMKYLHDQAWVIPTPRYPTYTFWWPWLKNYAGELSVGYFPGNSWVQWVWLDQELKKSMGY